MSLGPADVRLLARELEGLFAIDLCQEPGAGIGELAAALERAVRADPRHVDLTALVTALASDRSAAFVALVHDLAEICFLTREERSEYRNGAAAPGPWLFPKLMLEYALWSRRLDEVVGSLLAPFCARSCPSPPVGCCYLLGYDMGLVPAGMLRLQELEATLRGWSLPAEPDLHKCRYHTERGCALRLFKSPACLQHVCEPMRVELARAHGGERARELVDALQRFGACDIDRSRVFEELARVVEVGERCSKRPRTSS